MKLPRYRSQYGKLCDISDEELYNFLEENEESDAAFLAFICSEVLKRQLKERHSPAKYED
jgi:succinate dehydrogenase flavin-adding protein (antitoxin of CptAB toxin-antitoxin module)